MGDDRPPVYREGDRWVFRASALGHSCTTALLAHMLEFDGVMTVPEAVQRGYDEGHANEQRVIDEGLLNLPVKQIDPETGPFILSPDGQPRVEIPIGTRAIIRCHLDGIGECYMSQAMSQATWEPGDPFVLEAKFFGPDYWKKWHGKRVSGLDAFPGYKMQATIEHMGTGMPVLMLIGRKKGGRGKDRDTLVETAWQVFEPTPIDIARVKARVAKVLNAYDKLDPRCDWSALPPCDVNQYPCPFFQNHEDTVKAEVEVLDQMGEMADTVAALEQKVVAYNAAKFAADTAMETMRTLKPIIEELFRRLNRLGRKVRVGEFDVKYDVTEVEERTQTIRAHQRRTLTVDNWKHPKDKGKGKGNDNEV